MTGLTGQFRAGLQLYFRNRMAMFYGYGFPAIFLLAFWILYRHENVPLLRHMGQLLTVTILGGACLGMPTTIVSERERGVWRRYRLTPAPSAILVAGAVLLRFFILITAGLLQLALALATGMPFPQHPASLVVAFVAVSFSLLGLGLVMAALADNVPAVQALGQCVFLPMLIVGGVAVPLASLPDWALRLSAFFPGRYAVAALQSAFSGDSIMPARADLLALIGIGVAAMVAGWQLFRWDPMERFAARSGKAWLLLVLAAWIGVGLMARETPVRKTPPLTPIAQQEPVAPPQEIAPAAPLPTPAPTASAPTAPKAGKTGEPYAGPASWQAVTVAEIKRDVNFAGLPPDTGIVSPIARKGLDAPADMQPQLDALSEALPAWAPGNVADPVQRVRNLLYVAAVPDVLEMEIFEGYVPKIVFARLRKTLPQGDLVKVLYWVATHPSGGEDAAAGQLQPLGITNPPPDIETVRERVSLYAVKLIGRLIGTLPPD